MVIILTRPEFFQEKHKHDAMTIEDYVMISTS